MITEMQERADGKHAKRNRLGHVVTVLKIGYVGKHWRVGSDPAVQEQYYGGSVERFE